MKFPITDFFSNCDQLRRKPREKSLMVNFIFCALIVQKGKTPKQEEGCSKN